jgi:DNA polymerase elongation subunit (family B)
LSLVPCPVSRIPNSTACKQRRDVLKWLLVCCFGYTGYKNARFGKIEAHEAINAMAREKLLVAKEAAEARGFRVLHALVDSIYVQKTGDWRLGAGDWGKTENRNAVSETRKPKIENHEATTEFRFSNFDFQTSIENRPSGIDHCGKAADLKNRSALPFPIPSTQLSPQSPTPSPEHLAPSPQSPAPSRADYERLAQEIEQITGLPLALEAVYRFAVFLPSQQCAEIPVPNRFFCVSDDGELKVRGLECRRHDTPPYVTRMQREVLAVLAEARDFSTYCDKLVDAREVYERYQERLSDGTVPAEELVIRKRLTKAPASYQKNSSTAIAARQLDRAGVKLRPGENIEYIITDADSSLIDDRVRAWTLWEGWRGYDVKAYAKALKKAFEPAAHFGRTESSRRKAVGSRRAGL